MLPRRDVLSQRTSLLRCANSTFPIRSQIGIVSPRKVMVPSHSPGCFAQSYMSTSSTAHTTTTLLAFGSNRNALITSAALFAALSAGLSFALTHHYFDGLEGIQRAVSFYSLAIPKYIVYRYHQYMESPDHVWEQLDRVTSKQGLDIILRLKGFYIKCGQVCASNIGNAFPVIWQETMSILQDQVPPEDFDSVILPILREEIPNHEQIFTYIDPLPIGSASIGQVHRATMRINPNDSNDHSTRDVVIKICYPHVERLLRGDVRTIRAFCEIAQPVHVPAMKEVEKQFLTEFDYRAEAENLYRVRQNLTNANICGPDALCTVPYPYREYCTKRVLVMEEIYGDKLVDVLKRDGQLWLEWASALKSDFNANAEEKSTKRISTEEYEHYLAAMDTSRRIKNAWALLYNSSIGLFSGKKMSYQFKTDLPLNPAKLVDDLLYIHGHQVLVDGCFNADCHPGNFLLCRKSDGSPQLGLIDYGQ
jgi:aarF domain-containing kinase